MPSVLAPYTTGNTDLRAVFGSGIQYLRTDTGALENFGTVTNYLVSAAAEDQLVGGLTSMYRFTVPTPAVLPVTLWFLVFDNVSGALAGVGVVRLDASGNEADPVYPTVAGRTIDLTSGGAAGIDWANVENPTTSLALTGTTITPVYHADIQFTRDGSTQDEYTVTWFKDGVAQNSGITSPLIQVVKRVDGTDLVASTAMTQIGSTGTYKYTEATNKQTRGEAVLVIATATIDGSPRTWRKPLGRDA